MLDIIYEDDSLIAINKPNGLIVHKTPIAKDATEFALQLLRDQVRQYLYPIHRLDRKTSGVLLFAKNKSTCHQVQKLFLDGTVRKEYTAIVRGYTNKEGVIDYPLKTLDNKVQEAITRYFTIEHLELEIPLGKHSTSRYSLIKLLPESGRYHQLRKHMAHIFHPIIGDRPHGCNKQNRMWKHRLQLSEMLLHARKLSVPLNKSENLMIEAPFRGPFVRALQILGAKSLLSQL